jgi:hypothetical protein
VRIVIRAHRRAYAREEASRRGETSWPLLRRLAERCLELDPDRPLQAAQRLRTTTFLGSFELASDGLQVGHRLSVVQWRRGRRELVVADAA